MFDSRGIRVVEGAVQHCGYWFRITSNGNHLIYTAEDSNVPFEVVASLKVMVEAAMESLKQRTVDNERFPAELMTETRRSLTAKVLKYREQASHAYIKRLEEIAAKVAGLEPIFAWGSEWREICGCCEGHQPGVYDAPDGDLIYPPDDAPIEHELGCPVMLARKVMVETRK